MIILKKLEWSNCFSYGPDNSLNLCKYNVTQLLGTNGMGKSSIPLILEEILYNKNSKGFKKADISNRHLKDGYFINLEFSIDGQEYIIDVKRKNNLKVKLYKGTEDISSHTATNTYKTLEALLGLDFKTFSQLVLQSTRSSLQFLTATDTTRKKFLIDLFGLIRYTELFEIFKGAAKEASGELKMIEGEINTIQTWLNRNNSNNDTILPNIDIPNSPDKEEKELRSLLVEIENISEKNKLISQNNTYRHLLESIDITELQNKDLKIESTTKVEEALFEAKAGLKIAIRDIQSNIDVPDSCRTCGQTIDNSQALEILKKAELDRDNYRIIIDDLDPVITRIRAENLNKRYMSNKISEWEDLYTKINHDIDDKIILASNLESRSSGLQDKINKINTSIKLALSENTIIDKANSRVVLIEEQMIEFLQTLEISKEKMQSILNLSNNLETLKKSFSTNGLVAYKIENLVKDLESLTNEYLADLSDGKFAIEFVISKDKLNVEITDDARTVEVTALSSGELARVNTATLLAIRKLMSSISKSKINVLFLDEVISVLDEEGKEKLVEVLLKEQELNTFLVSHGWAHPLLDKIEVVKENKISRLE
jgi:DNA repair exonuclease SbcCD ATPase subunit